MKGRAPGGPSLFDLEDDTGPGAGEVASRAVDATASSPGPVPPAPAPRRTAYRGEPGYVFRMSRAEEEASKVEIPERSRWTFEGREVEVRGTSPLMVWFSEPGAPALSQATRYRHEFVKKAVRL